LNRGSLRADSRNVSKPFLFTLPSLTCPTVRTISSFTVAGANLRVSMPRYSVLSSLGGCARDISAFEKSENARTSEEKPRAIFVGVLHRIPRDIAPYPISGMAATSPPPETRTEGLLRTHARTAATAEWSPANQEKTSLALQMLRAVLSALDLPFQTSGATLKCF